MNDLQELSRDFPREVPLIRQLLSTVAKIQADQERLICQVNALIKYHRACAGEANELISDLDKCPTPKK